MNRLAGIQQIGNTAERGSIPGAYQQPALGTTHVGRPRVRVQDVVVQWSPRAGPSNIYKSEIIRRWTWVITPGITAACKSCCCLSWSVPPLVEPIRTEYSRRAVCSFCSLWMISGKVPIFQVLVRGYWCLGAPACDKLAKTHLNARRFTIPSCRGPIYWHRCGVQLL